jgi:hypothetical protein
MEMFTKIPLPVQGTLDLNTIPGTDEDVEESSTSRERSCSCKDTCTMSKDVDLTIILDRSGFVPGETLPFNLTLKKLSEKDVTVVKTVVRLVQYIFNYPVEDEESYIKTSSVLVETIPETKDDQRWIGALEIPITAPITKLGGSKIIDVQYCVQVKEARSHLTHSYG